MVLKKFLPAYLDALLSKSKRSPPLNLATGSAIHEWDFGVRVTVGVKQKRKQQPTNT